MLNFTFPNDNNVQHIFQEMLKYHLNGFSQDDIKGLAQTIAQSNFQIYNQVREQFKSTPRTPHYTFNLRDMSKVV